MSAPEIVLCSGSQSTTEVLRCSHITQKKNIRMTTNDGRQRLRRNKYILRVLPVLRVLSVPRYSGVVAPCRRFTEICCVSPHPPSNGNQRNSQTAGSTQRRGGIKGKRSAVEESQRRFRHSTRQKRGEKQEGGVAPQQYS